MTTKNKRKQKKKKRKERNTHERVKIKLFDVKMVNLGYVSFLMGAIGIGKKVN